MISSQQRKANTRPGIFKMLERVMKSPKLHWPQLQLFYLDIKRKYFSKRLGLLETIGNCKDDQAKKLTVYLQSYYLNYEHLKILCPGSREKYIIIFEGSGWSLTFTCLLPFGSQLIIFCTRRKKQEIKEIYSEILKFLETFHLFLGTCKLSPLLNTHNKSERWFSRSA